MRFNYNGITAGGRGLLFIAGPCVIESAAMTNRIADALLAIKRELDITLVFKASYDKANRTSKSSYRGAGMKDGLAILADIKKRTGLPILTDIHVPADAAEAANVADIVQIPAFLSRQTDILTAAVATGKAVNVKKGQFLSGDDARYIAEKCSDAANEKRLLLTERGNSFGYNNLVVDMRNLVIMRRYAPVIFDATHSVQLPSASGGVSGGGREFIPHLARAAAAVGVDGFFMEVHPEPEKGLSDAATMYPLADAAALWKDLIRIARGMAGE